MQVAIDQFNSIPFSKEFEINIKGCDAIFKFKAKSAQDCIDWVQCIQWNIQQSKGLQLKQSAPKVEAFWKQDQISELEFLETCDEFDVLLFQSNHTNAKLQRIATQSEYGKLKLKTRYLSIQTTLRSS